MLSYYHLSTSLLHIHTNEFIYKSESNSSITYSTYKTICTANLYKTLLVLCYDTLARTTQHFSATNMQHHYTDITYYV